MFSKRGFGTNCGIAAESCVRGWRNLAADRPMPPVPSLDALRDIRLHHARIRRDDIEFLWQFFDTDKRRRPLRLALKRFADGFAEFDRLGGFQDDHGNTWLQVLARHL